MHFFILTKFNDSISTVEIMHGAVGWKDNETECITVNNNIKRPTQLSLLNGALYCYIFRFLRNHHQASHTKNFKCVRFLVFFFTKI
jgi:hypothetical protein